jgi:hypothetical protein
MTRILTGLFDGRAEAERAAAELAREPGVVPGRVRIHASEHKDESGFMDWHARVWRPETDFLPPGDQALLAEGVRRGGCVVTAEVEEARSGRAMDVMERHGAVDLDAREAEWHRAGSTGYTGHDEDIGFATYGQDAVIGHVPPAAPSDDALAGTGAIGRAEVAAARQARRDEARNRPRVRIYMWETTTADLGAGRRAPR